MILQEVMTEYEPGCLAEKSTRSGSAIQTFNAYIMDLPMNEMFALILGTTHLISTTSMTSLMAMILSSSNQLWLPHLPKLSPLLLCPLKNGWRTNLPCVNLLRKQLHWKDQADCPPKVLTSPSSQHLPTHSTSAMDF